MAIPKKMRAWCVHEYGSALDVLKLQELDVPTPGDGAVLIKVEAIPLNLNDSERINGGNMMVRPDFPYSPGMEVTGRVVAVGNGAEYWMGKRVNAIPESAIGGYAEYCVCPDSGCFEIDNDIPFPDVAAIFFPFHLAWLGLYDRADLKAGETVLIHAAAGGSGSAAVQLAKLRGATVIATAGNNSKLGLCKDLGADHVVNYRTEDFHKKALELTNGDGVDVVFDNVGEAVMEKSMASLKYNGRYLMMGFASNKAVADKPFIVPRRVALLNGGMFSVMLAYAKPEMESFLKTSMGWNFVPHKLGVDIQKKLISHYKKSDIKTVVTEAIAFEDIPLWIDRMEKGNTSGRIVAVL